MSNPEVPGRKEDTDGMTDVMLMHRVVLQDRAAFAELFKRYAPKVKAYHLGLRASVSQADDLVQEVMVTIWRRASTYDETKASVSTWIYTIARNRFIDRVRKEKRSEIAMHEDDERSHKEQASDDRHLDEVLSLDKRAAVLREAMRALPPEQNIVISMAFLKEMSHGEIADLLGLPLGTVKSRIRLAMARLKNRLESVR